MKKSNHKMTDYYRKLSEHWDTADGTDGIDSLEDVNIVADRDIKSYVLSGQELILYLQGFLELQQVQQIKKLAQKKRISIQSQIKEWVLKGLKSEVVDE